MIKDLVSKKDNLCNLQEMGIRQIEVRDKQDFHQ